jgi:hypothetical protein
MNDDFICDDFWDDSENPKSIPALTIHPSLPSYQEKAHFHCLSKFTPESIR